MALGGGTRERARTFGDSEAELERDLRHVWLADQNLVLERIAAGWPLGATLDAIASIVEEQLPEVLCSILLLDETGRLHLGAAPSLPASYNQAVDRLAIGEGAGSCGTAAYRKRGVVVSDIAQDPLWDGFREVALAHGLRACWSTPIFSERGNVVGTFAMYYREPKEPQPRHLHLIEVATHLAGIAIHRTEAEEELRRREREFEAIVENAPDIIARFDREHRCVYINAAVERAFGLSPHDMIGKTTPEIDMPADLKVAWSDTLGRVIEIGAEDVLDFDLGTPAGRRWYQSRVVPEFAADGAVESVLAITRDITERRESEEIEALLREIDQRVLQAEPLDSLLGFVCERVARLFALGLVWIGRKDPDGVVNMMAQGGAQTEYMRDLHVRWDDTPEGRGPIGTAIRRGHPVVMDPRTNPQFEPWRKRARAHGLESVASIPLQAGDRCYGAMNLYAGHPDAFYPRLLHQLVRFSDQVLLSILHAEHQRQIRLQTAALESAANAIVITDRSGLIEWVNPAFTTVTGYDAAEVVGTSIRVLGSGAHGRSFYDELWETLLRGEPWQGQIQNTRRDGSRYISDKTITPVRGVEGDITHFISIEQDITERKQLEEQLRHAQRMEAIGRLAGGIAHDFNNILTAIKGYSEFLLEAIGPDDPYWPDLEGIQDAAERATHLTRQLLAFSRKQLQQPKSLDLGAIIAGVEKMLGRLIGEHIELAVASERELDPVWADPSQIEQIIVNLVVNARDAMPAGGRIEIEARNVDVDETSARMCNGAAPGRYVLLSVRDTGCGIAPEIQERIFDPFFTTKEKGRGTGLGLATIYGIVEQSRGCIQVDSTLGKGTTFAIYLPRAGEAVREPGHPRGSAAGRAPSRGGRTASGTILLAEDDEMVRGLARRVLEAAGYTVLEAKDGVEALEIAERCQDTIDLLLTDVIMPRLRGSDLVDHLRRDRPTFKVLFMSGYTDGALSELNALQVGIPFLEKPFTPDRLVKQVAEVLGRREIPM